MVEANKIHLEASEIQEQVEPGIERLDSLRTLLLKKKTPEADSLIGALDKLTVEFEEWESNLFEVPGFEHAHKQGEHHHHEHATAPELPAEKMLEVQKEIKLNIEGIRNKLELYSQEIDRVVKSQ